MKFQLHRRCHSPPQPDLLRLLAERRELVARQTRLEALLAELRATESPAAAVAVVAETAPAPLQVCNRDYVNSHTHTHKSGSAMQMSKVLNRWVHQESWK